MNFCLSKGTLELRRTRRIQELHLENGRSWGGAAGRLGEYFRLQGFLHEGWSGIHQEQGYRPWLFFLGPPEQQHGEYTSSGSFATAL